MKKQCEPFWHFSNVTVTVTMLFLCLESDSSSSPSESDSCSSQTERSTAMAAHAIPQLPAKRLSLGFALASRTHHYGSFYLRMGAVGELVFKYVN